MKTAFEFNSELITSIQKNLLKSQRSIQKHIEEKGKGMPEDAELLLKGKNKGYKEILQLIECKYFNMIKGEFFDYNHACKANETKMKYKKPIAY
jgi:hypothetical protein